LLAGAYLRHYGIFQKKTFGNNSTEMGIDMEQSKEDVYVLLDRIVTLHELQASLEDIDVEVAKARKLLDELDT
tara:strand:+ start:3912 stop:4130 length:219 start_codon:yes stop_codon:yes gene_type:complete